MEVLIWNEGKCVQKSINHSVPEQINEIMNAKFTMRWTRPNISHRFGMKKIWNLEQSLFQVKRATLTLFTRHTHQCANIDNMMLSLICFAWTTKCEKFSVLRLMLLTENGKCIPLFTILSLNSLINSIFKTSNIQRTKSSKKCFFCIYDNGKYSCSDTFSTNWTHSINQRSCYCYDINITRLLCDINNQNKLKELFSLRQKLWVMTLSR